MQEKMTEGYELSPQQKHLWRLHEEDRASPYKVQFASFIEGELDRSVLERALAMVVRRHEILRTSLRRLPGLSLPLQVVGDGGLFPGMMHDLSGLNPQEQEVKRALLFQEMLGQSLELASGPLLKWALVRLAKSRHWLLIGLPALCADAKSVEILLREISRAYAACLTGEQLTDEPMQYADLSEWQNELLKAEDAKKASEYWNKEDVAALLPLDLACREAPVDKSGFAPRFLSCPLRPEVARGIHELAAKHDASASAFFLACWQVLLRSLTGKSDLAVGVACEGRTYQGLEAALGPLAKYLPFCGRCDGNGKFTELLTRTGDALRELFDWQEYFSWEAIAEGAGTVSNPSWFPLAYRFEDRTARHQAGDLVFTIDQQYVCVDRFELELRCAQGDDVLSAELHYDSNLFRAEDIQRIASQFQCLLENVTAAPEASLGNLDILSEAERRKLLLDFNDTKDGYCAETCIHHIIEQQVERVPNHIAVEFEGQQLTYAELNARANQLAHRLVVLGVGPEVLVGICVDRGLDMMIGILGILKAGGAYVPLDPTYPKERLGFMLEDAGVSVLLSYRRLSGVLPESKAQIVYLDTEWKDIAAENATTPVSQAGPDNLAYVIYTSGSTGKPKGVQITHRSLAHSTHARATYYAAAPKNYLLLSSFAFDSSVAGIFWTLCAGGALCLPKDKDEQDPARIAKLIDGHQVSHLLCLPSLYALLLAEGNLQQLGSLCTVIVAGEACPKDLVERHRQTLPQTALFNEYGPTEGTVWTSVYDCRSHGVRSRIPIGRPIANARIYILDSDLKPVPIGAPGELYIGGSGLARGYLNHAALTADKFIPDAFGSEPGARLYKTGDLACYLPDGNVEFLGRTDHQVKIRGYRIELEEIEAVLRQHPDIRESVALVHENNSGDKSVIAYLVARALAPSTSELHGYLRSKLPEYMIPSTFVFLNQLPRTPNGKVDRLALPEPDLSRPNLRETFVEPRGPVEEVMASIWSEVLRIDQIGVNDNFFELGGHSIIATRLVSRIREVFQVEVALRSLFEAPTVAALSGLLLRDPLRSERAEKAARLWLRLARLSDEEVKSMLGEKTASSRLEPNK